MEMDTVAHCGDQLAGEFIYSLDMVEIATGWSEQIAVMGKSEAGVIKAIEEIKQGLPFVLKGLDSDTGSEIVPSALARQTKYSYMFQSCVIRPDELHRVSMSAADASTLPDTVSPCTPAARCGLHSRTSAADRHGPVRTAAA